jgi:hypothetical protein
MKITLLKLVIGLTLIYKTMKKLFSRSSLILQIFQDDKGNYSSNRFVGIMCALSLCITMYHNQFTTEEFAPAPMLIQSVAALAFGALGLGAATRIFKKENNNEQN